jgi:hypothetical protein
MHGVKILLFFSFGGGVTGDFFFTSFYDPLCFV